MKKLVYILITFIIAFSACDPNEDIYDELDKLQEPYSASVEYTFTADDYATAAEYAIDDAVTVDDTSYAELIESMNSFNQYFTANDYVGKVLAELYPEYSKNSTAMVTYNYIAEMPEDQKSYLEVDDYELTPDDYDGVDSLVKITQYLYPEFNPDLYLPVILANAMPSPEDGDQYLVSYNYSDVTPVINIVNNTKVFEEEFNSAVDDEVIAIDNWSQFIEVGTEQWEGREYSGNLYAQFSAFGSGEASNIGWLITSAIDLTEYSEVMLNFKSKDGYNNGDPVKIYISDDYSGTGDPTSATWEDLSATFSTGNSSGYASSWTESGDISLNDYTGGPVYIAFKYAGGDGDITTTIQIDDFAVTALTAGFEVIGPDDYTVKEYYEYDGSEWGKMPNVHYLNSKDYDAMGDPGAYNNFSADALPQDYLPKYLDKMHPTAGEGVSAVVIYKYYTGIEGTVTLATQFTFTQGDWVSAYNYIESTTNQFVHNGTEWLFDPTIEFTMASSDYQLIVDYVELEFGEDYIDSYGTADYYYGTSAYHNNFSTGETYWETEEFDSWEKAVEEAIGVVLLPALYPNTDTQANGVDLYYNVIFGTYESGANKNYLMRFDVTKAGPNPEFTLVDGPTLL